MFHFPHQHVVDINLVGGGGLRLNHVGEIASIGRPSWRFLGNLARVGQVHELTVLGRNQEDVPLLVAVIIGLVGDPLAVGRPGGRGLALIADGKLQGPAALGSNQPQVVSAAKVRNKGNHLSIRRPGRTPDHARHVELFNRQILLDLSVGPALDLPGVGDGRRRRERLSQGDTAHKDHDNKQEDGAHRCSSGRDNLRLRALVNLHRAPGFIGRVAEGLQRTVDTFGGASVTELAAMPDDLVRK